MELTLPNAATQVAAYLILPNQQISTGIITNSNKVIFKNIPQNEKATLLLIEKNNDQAQLYLYNDIITQHTIQLTTTSAITQAQAKAKLDALGKLL
jgi:hypothetical protein